MQVLPIREVSANTTDISSHFTKHGGVAPFRSSGWGNGFKVAHNLTLEEAMEMADSDPQIKYFFYTNAKHLVLEISPSALKDRNFNPIDTHNDPLGLIQDFGRDFEQIHGWRYARVLHEGDVVFFNREDMWLNDASPDLLLRSPDWYWDNDHYSPWTEYEGLFNHAGSYADTYVKNK